MRRTALCLLGLCLVSLSWGLSPTLRNDLLAEYMFANSTADTSGRNVKTSLAGTITYDKLPGTDLYFANLSNGQVGSDIAWTTDAYGEYTISFWIKHMTPAVNSSGSLSYFQNLTVSPSTGQISQYHINLGYNFINPSSPPYTCVFTNFISSCNQNEWYHIVISKTPNMSNTYVNGQLISSNVTTGSTNGNVGIGRVNRLGGTALAFAQFRMFKRGVTVTEVQELYNEFSVSRSNIQATTTTTTSIPTIFVRSFSSDIFNFELNNVQTTQMPGTATYEYSWNGTTFSSIPTASFVAGSTGKYSFPIDASSRPYGPLSLTIRMKIGATTTVLGTFNAERVENLPVITINNPSTSAEKSKTLTASTDKGTLQMRIQTNNSCSGTGDPFEDYLSMTFASLADNGKYVCYKATYNGKSSYKVSNIITGIQREDIVDAGNIWKDYLSWKTSPKQKANDTTFTILTFLSNSTGGQFIDINGDGLVDLLYKGNIGSGTGYAIMLNNGDLTFDIQYKCVVGGSVYYGDCAAQ